LARKTKLLKGHHSVLWDGYTAHRH